MFDKLWSIASKLWSFSGILWPFSATSEALWSGIAGQTLVRSGHTLALFCHIGQTMVRYCRLTLAPTRKQVTLPNVHTISQWTLCHTLCPFCKKYQPQSIAKLLSVSQQFLKTPNLSLSNNIQLLSIQSTRELIPLNQLINYSSTVLVHPAALPLADWGDARLASHVTDWYHVWWSGIYL